MSKARVLVMVDWYAPGFKAGGPIRSAVNFADQLEDELDIYVFTTDRDLGDQQAYTGIEMDRWTPRNDHHVLYASPEFLRWGNILAMIKELKPAHILLNSMFSRYGTIYPLLMKRLGRIDAQVVLAPRGMLKASALGHKPGKKKVFLALFKLLGLSRGVCFQVTDETERRDVQRIIGPGTALFQAGNLPGRQLPFREPPAKEAGSLKMVFVGRFHPIKNLELLLRALGGVTGRVDLTVIATPEDPAYQEQCQAIARDLPANIRVDFLMNVPHEKIEAHILSNHIFALPTRGENFGHAIFEALAAGRPVLVSDQTPWRGLEAAQAGWDLPIDDPGPWRAVIDAVIAWDQRQLDTWCRGAWQKAADYLAGNALKQSYLKQFN